MHRPFPLSGLTFPLLCLGAPPIPTVGYSHSHYCVLVHRPFPLSGIHIPITVSWCTAHSHCRVFTFPLLCLGAPPNPIVGSINIPNMRFYIPILHYWVSNNSQSSSRTMNGLKIKFPMNMSCKNGNELKPIQHPTLGI